MSSSPRSFLAYAFATTLFLALAAAADAHADPASLTGAYSEYETSAIHDAENELGSRLDPSPEGKTIERIDFIRIDPIDHRDPLPTSLDYVHTTSKTFVLRRNLLIAEGQPWRSVLVDESARNLRRLRQLSLVVCVPMIGSSSDRVRLVVITKDVWSLYVDFDLAVTSGGLESLTLEPKETNIAGVHHVALGRFVLQPQTLTLGASYEIPRVQGRWLSLAADANAVMNRESGSLEGGFGSVDVKRPLYSSQTEWAWSTGTKFGNQLTRRYVNAAVATFTPPPSDDVVTPAGAAAAAAKSTSVPWMWRERKVIQDAKVTRSFGWESKNDFSLGASFAHTKYDVPPDASLDPRAVAAFTQAAVPVGENRVGPFLQWHSYRSDFLRTYDLETLGLQEDQRFGHDLWVRLYPVLNALGSTRDLFGTYAGAAYGVPLGDGVARAAIEATVEAEPGHGGQTRGRIADASVNASFGIATPRFGPRVFKGRFVFGATALNRVENYLNAQSFLGGDTLLRGYPSRYLAGKDLVAANLEYRTRSFDLSAIQLGAAFFYDVGDAMNGFDRIDPKQSVGGGLRIVFPQIDRAVLRIDVGVPLSSEPRPADVPPVSVFVAFHHALTLPTVGGDRGP